MALQMLKAKWITNLKEPTGSFAGKTIIVTGGNTGLGFEAAIKFSALDASKVILAVRDIKKGEVARAAIETRTGKSGHVEVWQLDMSSYASIQAFADRAKQLARLDIAVLNAGVNKASHVISKYGWEETLQINTISTVLLGLLLLPKLKQTNTTTGQTPVLEFTGTGFHQTVQIVPSTRSAPNILEAYNAPELFNPQRQYSISKLFLRYATNKLASKIPASDIIIVTVCPGATATGLAREYQTGAMKVGVSVFQMLFGRKAEEGAKTLVSGTQQGAKAHGEFWNEDTIRPPAPTVVGKENEMTAELVWKNIIEALSKDVPVVPGLVNALGL